MRSAGVSAQLCRPSTSMTASTRRSTEAASQPPWRGSRTRAECAMFSRTVSSRIIVSSCGTKPVTRRKALISSCMPFTCSVPAVRATLPMSTLRKVVLPAPEGPITAVTRPGEMRPVTLLRIVLLSGGGSVSRRPRKSMPRRRLALQRRKPSSSTSVADDCTSRSSGFAAGGGGGALRAEKDGKAPRPGPGLGPRPPGRPRKDRAPVSERRSIGDGVERPACGCAACSSAGCASNPIRMTRLARLTAAGEPAPPTPARSPSSPPE